MLSIKDYEEKYSDIVHHSYHVRVVSVIDADTYVMGLTLQKYVNSERYVFVAEMC
jgi:hypothetical protein